MDLNKRFRKQCLWIFETMILVAAICTVVLTFQACFPDPAHAKFLPPVTNKQISIGTSGYLNENRYKQGFSFDILFMQTELFGDTKAVMVMEMSKHNGRSNGALSGFVLQPVGNIFGFTLQNNEMQRILNKVYVIGGTGLTLLGENLFGGGLMADLDFMIPFYIRTGHREHKGGFAIPIFKRSMHFGFTYEQKNYDDLLDIDTEHKGGVMFGIALNEKSKKKKIENREEALKQAEEAQKWLQDHPVDSERNDTGGG